MAEKAALDDSSLFCSICLDVLQNPVSLHCGHSFCMDCLNAYWDQEDHRRAYNCPQCRHAFKSRPVLSRNTVLTDLIGKMSAAGPSRPPSAAGVASGDVKCDFCSVKKQKAVKSCLVCLASYCATHLQPHFESAAFKRHKLVEVSTSIQEKICPKHDKLLEVFCRTDDQCICLLCVMDDHKGHDTVSAAGERKEKQKQFGSRKIKYQQKIQETEKQLHQLKLKMKGLESFSNTAVDENEKAHAEIVLMADAMHCAVRELIRQHEKAVMGRAEALQGRLEKEISELRRAEEELKQLALTEDHIYFLQQCKPIFERTELDVSDDFQPKAAFDFISKAVSDSRFKMEKMAKDIAELSKTIQINPDPTTREEFLMYSCTLSLDPNTVFKNLVLSEGNRKVTWMKTGQKNPNHPERFTKYDQVLCSEALSGVCYYEVEWRGPKVEVAMSYKGAEVEESGFDKCTDKCWCMSLSKSGCTFWHNETKTKIPTDSCSTVGVYLNHKAGCLSFYSVSDSGEMMLLHRVQATFTQPLHPGFIVSRGASVKIVTPE